MTTTKIWLGIVVVLILVAIYNRSLVLKNKRRSSLLFMEILDKRYSGITCYQDVLDIYDYIDKECYDKSGEFTIHGDYIASYYAIMEDLRRLEVKYGKIEAEKMTKVIPVVHTTIKGEEFKIEVYDLNNQKLSVEFDSLTEAGQYLVDSGIVKKLETAKSGICRNIKNNRNSKSYKNYIWKYKKVENEWTS
jgi:hypothetical protein